MPTLPSLPRSGRALVLGGGGSTGNAWLIGFVAGLVDAGLDVTGADLIVGTSAGATAAAQLTGSSPADQYAAILAAAPPPVPATGPTGRSVADHLERTNRIIAAATDPADLRRRLGATALDLAEAAGDGARDRWRATVAARLPAPLWPQQDVSITAVDAETGEPAVFDRDSGVDLVDAVAASCASGFAYRIGDRHFIDGGYRRNENADLAAGSARVLVLAPLGGRTRTPPEWRQQLSAQVDELRAAGSRVETAVPETDALFGVNAMNAALRPAAARAGHTQARVLAPRLTRFWAADD